jgi:hypothetical protein
LTKRGARCAQGRPGQSAHEGGEECAVRWREAGFVDLALEDGELVAKGKYLDVLVGIADRQ